MIKLKLKVTFDRRGHISDLTNGNNLRQPPTSIYFVEPLDFLFKQVLDNRILCDPCIVRLRFSLLRRVKGARLNYCRLSP